MGALFIVLPRTLVSAGRINQVLDLHSSNENPSQPGRQILLQVKWNSVVSAFLYSKNSNSCGTCQLQGRNWSSSCPIGSLVLVNLRL